MGCVASSPRLWVWSNVRKTALVLAVTIVAFLFCLPLGAQVNTGRIAGEVTDQSGGAIAGAKVTVIDVARGENRDLVSDSAGEYAAPNLIPGIYTVRAEYMGFKTVDRQNIEVGVGSDNRVDITLQPGEQTQTITVTEALPMVNTTNAQTGATLDNQYLSELPINGRNYRWQIGFVPGIMMGVGGGTSNQTTNGTTQAGGSWNMIIDGLYSDTLLVRNPGVNGADEGGDTVVIPADAVQEVNIIASTPKAEYGWAAGVTYDVGLKSGTNNIHGSAYAYGRDEDLDGRNAFAAERSPVNYEQFGGSLGGPIKKDKIFYFAAFQGTRSTHASAYTLQDPTLANWTGSAGGCTTLASGNCTNSAPDAIADINDYIATHPGTNVKLSQLSLNLMGCNAMSASITNTTVTPGLIAACASGNQFGAPGLLNNTSGNTTTVGYDFPQSGGSNNGLFKIDYHVSDHHDLHGSFFIGRYLDTIDEVTPIQQYWQELDGAQSDMGRLVEIWTPNSNWLNQARVGVDHSYQPISAAECSTNGYPSIPSGIGAVGGAVVEGVTAPNYLTQYGFSSGAPACGFPTLSISGFTGTLGAGSSVGKQDWENMTQGADSVSYTRGSHQFKFGVDVRAENFDGAKVNDGQRGLVTFGSSGFSAFANGATVATPLEDFLSGEPATESIRPASDIRHVTTNKIGLFAQDDWRIKPRLMLNLGLRWEMETPERDANGLLGNFAPGTPTGMIQNNQIFKFQSNFEPRLGFAWDVTGKGTTVVRAGGGSLYMIPKLMDYCCSSGSSATTEDYASEPTGSTLYNANGTFFNVNGSAVTPSAGTIDSGQITPTAVTTGGSSGTITAAGALPWQASATGSLNPVFTTLTPQCGNGLAPAGAGIPAGAPALNPAPCSGEGGNPNLHNFTYWYWDLGVQHAFTNNVSLDVSYVGSRSYSTLQTLNLNLATPGLSGGSTEQLREPFFSAANNGYDVAYPWFKSINYITQGGGANYNSMQMRLTVRDVHGFTLAFNSTLSHTQLQTMVQDVPGLVNGDYSLDVFEHFAMTATYAIPGIKSPGQMLQGWEANATVTVMTALPLIVTDSQDDLFGTGGSDPWNLYGPAAPFDKVLGGAGNALANSGAYCYGVANSTFAKAGCITVPAGTGVAGSATFVSNLPPACVAGATAAGTSSAAGVTSATDPTGYNGLAQLARIGCYEVNGSAMVPPAQGMYGTIYPGEIRGKGRGLLNASVTKDWKIKERLDTQFRFEVFNVLNRVMYAGQGVNLATPSALGQATDTPDVAQGNSVVGDGGPREMQLALKFIF